MTISKSFTMLVSCIIIAGLLGSVSTSQGPLRRAIEKRRAAKQQVTYSAPAPVYSVVYDTPAPATPVQEYVLPPVEEVAEAPAAPAPKLVSKDVVETAGRVKLRRALVKAVRSARKKEAITANEAVTIRVALFSPAFVRTVETLCVTQMVFSGDEAAEALPTTEDGKIDADSIDWEGFADFLERILPLILELLLAFGLV